MPGARSRAGRAIQEQSLGRARTELEHRHLSLRGRALIADGRVQLDEATTCCSMAGCCEAPTGGAPMTVSCVLAAALAWHCWVARLGPARQRRSARRRSRPLCLDLAWRAGGVSTLGSSHNRGGTWTYCCRAASRADWGFLYPMRPQLESVLRVGEQGVQPLHYRASDGTSANERGADVTFDWDAAAPPAATRGSRSIWRSNRACRTISRSRSRCCTRCAGAAPAISRMIDKNSIRDYTYRQEGTETIIPNSAASRPLSMPASTPARRALRVSGARPREASCRCACSRSASMTWSGPWKSNR